MIRSREIVDQALSGLSDEFVHCCGRGDDWWFAGLLRQAGWTTPCALTGNQIAVLAALSLDRQRAIQVTVQPNAPTASVIDLVRQCQLIPDSVLQSLPQVVTNLADAGVAAHLGIGAVLDPTTDEARIYVGCPDDGNHEGLVAALSRSPLWCRPPSPRLLSALDVANATGPLIGMARRFGSSDDQVLYFTLADNVGFESIAGIARALGVDAIARLRAFWTRLQAGPGSTIKWGWAVITRADGRLRYLKLEASADSTLLTASGLLRSTCDLDPDRELTSAVRCCGLRMVPQTLSCAVGPDHQQTSCYFGIEFAEDSSAHQSAGRRLVAPAGPSSAVRARDRAVRTIVAAQSPDGAWSDFEIAGVGASDQWVTAHVGLKLAGLQSATGQPELCRAQAFVAEAMSARCGLGYNAASPVDADSTSHALLFRQALGHATTTDEVAALLSFQHEGGAFATFQPTIGSVDSSWTVGHAEVTAVAIQALWPMSADRRVRDSIDRALDWADQTAGWEACARSFWWNLDWYARLQWIRALSMVGRAVPRPLLLPVDDSRLRITSHLDAACLLELCLSLDRVEDAHLIVLSLVESQGHDGLWPAAPVLRVVDDTCYAPWAEPHRVILHADAGLYSGASIMAAIDRYLARMRTHR